MNKILYLIAMLFVAMVAGCASNEHLLFFTNSSLGVDISVEQGQTPVKFVVGYKRQEGVLDPIGQGYGFQKAGLDPDSSVAIADSKEIITTKDGYFYPLGVRSEPHSVIAKMNFGATGGGSADTSAAQWFATGKAAEELAKNPATPAAISGNSDIIPVVELNQRMGKEIRQITILKLAYKQLDDYVSGIGKDDIDAISIKKTVDEIDDGEFRKEFKKFHISDNRLIEQNYPEVSSERVAHKSFANVADYLVVLRASIQNGADVSTNTLNEAGTESIGSNKHQQVIKTLIEHQDRFTRLQDSISRNKDVIKMINIALFK